MCLIKKFLLIKKNSKLILCNSHVKPLNHHESMAMLFEFMVEA